MKSALLLVLSAIAVAAFAGANWTRILEPSELNLGYSTVQAPLGLILLTAVGVALLAWAITLAWAHMTITSRHNAHVRERERLRALAEEAEASRLTQMRGWLEAQLEEQSTRAEQRSSQLLQRIDRLERDLRTYQDEGTNSLAAHFGHLEDRLENTVDKRDPRQRLS
jgi:hypothetical protein